MTRDAELDPSWLNDRSDFQRNWVHGQRNVSGLRLAYHLDDDRVIGVWTAGEEHVGFPGFVHGGLISAVLDDVMGRAPAMRKRWVVTGRLTVRYLRGAPTGVPLRIEGWITRFLRRVVYAESRMLHPDGSVIAQADGTYLPVPEPMLGEMLEAWPGFAAYVRQDEFTGR